MLFFSLFRELAGADEFPATLPDSGARVTDLLALLGREHPALRDWEEKMLVAVNCEYADFEQELKDGDEVALMPPVQGG
ncbi:MAG: MoaD/ThiS family protein, partial [Verrucomicrobiota bacterium]